MEEYNSTLITYHLKEDKLSAAIQFKDKVFQGCKFSDNFNSFPTTYSLKHWEFLGKVAKRIQELNNDFR